MRTGMMRVQSKLEKRFIVGKTDARAEPWKREERSVFGKECCGDVDAFDGDNSVTETVKRTTIGVDEEKQKTNGRVPSSRGPIASHRVSWSHV